MFNMVIFIIILAPHYPLMSESEKVRNVIGKLNAGICFGLFDGSNMTCYFSDGEKVSYGDLWKALRVIYDLGDGVHHKTIPGLCPELYAGSFPYRFEKHKWKKKKIDLA